MKYTMKIGILITVLILGIFLVFVFLGTERNMIDILSGATKTS